jgi:sporulation protein YlmC with PRC-barrel domain
MKKLLVGIATLVVATPLVAGAQTSRPSDRPASSTTRDSSTTKQRDTTGPAWKAEGNVVEHNELIGTRIKNTEGKEIGKIERLLIDPQTGRITHVVVGLGGFLGVGEKNVVVPWSEIKTAAAQNGGRKPTLVMEQSKLETAPRYERSAARSDRSPSASPSTERSRSTTGSTMKDSDKDGKRDSADKAPSDPTKK